MTTLMLIASLITLPAPTPAEFPITEAETNVTLDVEALRLGTVRFMLTLDASPSNNLEIAVGTDMNFDGDLSLEEADFTFGYDCAKWFLAETETGCITEEPAPTVGRVTRTLEIRRKDWNPAWNRLRLVRRGTGEANATATYEGHYPGMVILIK